MPAWWVPVLGVGLLAVAGGAPAGARTYEPYQKPGPPPAFTTELIQEGT